MNRKTKVISWIIALLGLWEFGDVVAPFVPGFGTVHAFVWNHVIVGIILMFAGAWAALTRDVSTARTMDWIATVTGLWLIVASYVLRNSVIAVGLWNDIAVGAIVVILSSASRLLLRRRV